MGLISKSVRHYNLNSYDVQEEGLLKDIDEELYNQVERAEVQEKEQKWGTSVSICLFLQGNEAVYLPLDKDCTLEVGDQVDVESIYVKALSRPGDEEPIFKGDGSVLEDEDEEEEEEEEKSKKKTTRKARK